MGSSPPASERGSVTAIRRDAAEGGGGEFRIRLVLTQTFRSLLARPGTFLLLSLLPALVLANVGDVGSIAQISEQLSDRTEWPHIFFFGLHVVWRGFIVVLALGMVAAFGTFRALSSSDVGFGEFLRPAWRRILALLGLAAVLAAVLAAGTFAEIFVRSIFGIQLVPDHHPSVTALLLLSLGTLALGAIHVLAIPALTMLSVSVPACVVELLGPMASMARSVRLTRGCRWKLFGILLFAGFIGGG